MKLILYTNKKVRTRSKMYGRGVLDSIANRVLDTSINQLLPGEKHAPQMVNGKLMPSVYTGPGTQLETRIRRGDKPLTFSDTESEAHDLRYALAANGGDVRAADVKMLEVLRTGLAAGKDIKFNVLPAYYGIRAKVAAERLGVPQSFFTTFGREHQGPDLNHVYEVKLHELEQQGFGTPRRFTHGLRM